MLRYLEMDVRQLCDVYEAFRRLTKREDRVHGAHCLTISQLAMSSALKMVGKPIQLCPSPEMYRFFEKSIRGGISFCNTHRVVASNPYVNPEQTTVRDDDINIMYVDENNLYGAALSMKMPVSHFHNIPNEDAELIDWANIDTEGDWGYFLEVDLVYP